MMDSIIELDEAVIPVTVEYLEEDGVYKVSCPLLPGCHAWGRTLDDAMRAVPENVRAMIAARLANGSPIPASLEHLLPHTRLVIRMVPA
jgi:predicted RNase H-like HicB family nuclease